MRQSRLYVLALLLLADGEPVPAWKLRAHTPNGRVIRQPTLRTHLQRLRALGCRIERAGGMLRYGYRLLEIPPDDLLEDLLAIVREIRGRRPDPPQPAARGSATTPFVRRLFVGEAPTSAAGAIASGR